MSPVGVKDPLAGSNSSAVKVDSRNTDRGLQPLTEEMNPKPPGNENCAVVAQCRRVACPRCRHVASRCERSAGRVEQLRRPETQCHEISSSCDQNFSVAEQRRRMARARLTHAAGRCKSLVSWIEQFSCREDSAARISTPDHENFSVPQQCRRMKSARGAHAPGRRKATANGIEYLGGRGNCCPAISCVSPCDEDCSVAEQRCGVRGSRRFHVDGQRKTPAGWVE